VKAWQRTRVETSCGACSALIGAGDASMLLTQPGWTAVRCADCAGEPVPASLDHDTHAPTPVATIGPRFAERLSAVRSLAQDFKHAQAGDRR